MNLMRCPNCGEDLVLTNTAASQAITCPRCGQQTADPSTTRKVRDDPATQTSAPRDDSKDTDVSSAMVQTMELKAPSTKPTTIFTTGQGSENYDFLAPPESPDELGRLGTYRMLKVLGVGGMGIVFEAEDPALQRHVAVKAMLPALAATVLARQRFLREARAAAAIEHERIVPIFQVGEDRGIPYLVMPLLKGETLEERLSRVKRLPIAETVRISREIAEALQAAHDRGLIHRDIKPANVWLEGTRATVKLLDFGLARSAEAVDSHLTQQGNIYGTPAYMAPEQARAENVDARTDLFSLGCVIYRMCAGTMPFQGTSAVTILLAIVNKQPPAPADIDPEIPAALSQLIMQLLAKDPAERPASAQAVIDALDAIQPRSEPTRLGMTVRLPVAPTLEKIGLPASPTTVPLPSATALLPSTLALQPAQPAKEGSRIGKLFIGALGLAAVLGAAAWLIPGLLNRPTLVPAGPAEVGPVEIGVTYGSEKEGWFKEAVIDFAAAPEGKNIKVNLLPMGSVEGGQAVTRNEDQRIHVWSPASSIYKGSFVKEWQDKHAGQNPILKEESLCMTPMVFVFWKERHDAFLAKYKTVSFKVLAEAMEAKNGWGDIAGRAEWGRFRFGHTNPEKSNSGLIALLMMACETNQDRPITPADLNDTALQSRLAVFKKNLGGKSNSTGNLMKDMVTKGPNAFDAVFVYENLAIDYLKAAQGRWGDLHVAYPQRNIWSENPYYILDVPWSSKEQRRAAETFLAFLASVPMQQKALAHGFRPTNINIPIRDDAASPFVRHKQQGLTVNITSTCDVGSAAIIDDLLHVWESAR